MSSRLLEYEVWNRVHAYGLTRSHATEARALPIGIELVEMDRPVLARALEPFPIPLRTFDGLHLATMDCLSSSPPALGRPTLDETVLRAAPLTLPSPPDRGYGIHTSC